MRFYKSSSVYNQPSSVHTLGEEEEVEEEARRSEKLCLRQASRQQGDVASKQERARGQNARARGRGSAVGGGTARDWEGTWDGL